MLEEKANNVEESRNKEDRNVVMLKDVTARLRSVVLVIIIYVLLIIIIYVLIILVIIIHVYVISRWENGEEEATLTKISLEVAI